MIQCAAKISRVTIIQEVLESCAACMKGLAVLSTRGIHDTLLSLKQIVVHDSLISKQMTGVFVHYRHLHDSKIEQLKYRP